MSAPLCACKNPMIIRTVAKEGPNQGREFWTCSLPKEQACKSFVWVDGKPSNLPQKRQAPQYAIPNMRPGAQTSTDDGGEGSPMPKRARGGDSMEAILLNLNEKIAQNVRMSTMLWDKIETWALKMKIVQGPEEEKQQ